MSTLSIAQRIASRRIASRRISAEQAPHGPGAELKKAAQEVLGHFPGAGPTFQKDFLRESAAVMARYSEYVEPTEEVVRAIPMHSLKIAGFSLDVTYEVDVPAMFAHVMGKLHGPSGVAPPDSFGKAMAWQGGMNLIRAGIWSNPRTLKLTLGGEQHTDKGWGVSELLKVSRWQVEPGPRIDLGNIGDLPGHKKSITLEILGEAKPLKKGAK